MMINSKVLSWCSLNGDGYVMCDLLAPYEATGKPG